MPQLPKCNFCRRQLTNKISIALGVGPECAEKRTKALGGIGCSEKEIVEIEKRDPRRANLIVRALAVGTRKSREDAALFLAQARKYLGNSELSIAV